jgi:di/tripeptidase
MNPALNGQEPRRVLELFSQILRIPRMSHQEDEMVRWITQWATSRGYPVVSDEAKNVLVKQDVYVWKIKLTNIHGKTKELTGKVTILK